MLGAATLHGLLTLSAPHVVTAKDRALHQLCRFYIVPVNESGLIAPSHHGLISFRQWISKKKPLLATLYQD